MHGRPLSPGRGLKAGGTPVQRSRSHRRCDGCRGTSSAWICLCPTTIHPGRKPSTGWFPHSRSHPSILNGHCRIQDHRWASGQKSFRHGTGASQPDSLARDAHLAIQRSLHAFEVSSIWCRCPLHGRANNPHEQFPRHQPYSMAVRSDSSLQKDSTN